MNELTGNNDLRRAFFLFSTEALDAANLGVSLLTRLEREEELSAGGIEKAETSINCFKGIRNSIYKITDFIADEPNLGRYNVRDFLTNVCMGLNNYLGGVFDVDISYNIKDEDNLNLVFDSKLVEKAMYDAVFSLLCGSGIRNRRITIYAKDLSGHLKITVRCEGKIKEMRNNLTEMGVLFPQYRDTANKSSYAELAIKKMNGMYKKIHRQNEAKIELYIPNNLEIKSFVMREDESYVRLGETVMTHKSCEKRELEEFFVYLFISQTFLNNNKERR